MKTNSNIPEHTIHLSNPNALVNAVKAALAAKRAADGGKVDVALARVLARV